MMNIPIIMTAEERLIAEHYAEVHSLSLEEAFKKALFEKIEKEYGIVIDHNVNEVIYQQTTHHDDFAPWLDIPNETTASAIKEGRELIKTENADGYKDIDELRDALDLTEDE